MSNNQCYISDAPAHFYAWGASELAEPTRAQWRNARRLAAPVTVAQMPDCHVGYGLPIGGGLATRNAVIPYGVGVDIACRMKLSIINEDVSRIAGMRDKLRKVLQKETAFGIGSQFRNENRREH